MKRFHREALKPRAMGNLITCRDCGVYGYVALSGGEIVLPPGWRMAWVGFKPLYICGECAGKRRKRFT